MRSLASKTNLDDAALVFHQQPNCLPAKLPLRGEFSDPIVTLECRSSGADDSVILVGDAACAIS